MWIISEWGDIDWDWPHFLRMTSGGEKPLSFLLTQLFFSFHLDHVASERNATCVVNRAKWYGQNFTSQYLCQIFIYARACTYYTGFHNIQETLPYLTADASADVNKMNKSSSIYMWLTWLISVCSYMYCSINMSGPGAYYFWDFLTSLALHFFQKKLIELLSNRVVKLFVSW